MVDKHLHIQLSDKHTRAKTNKLSAHFVLIMFIYLMSSLIENLLIEMCVYCYEIPVSSFVVLITVLLRVKNVVTKAKRNFLQILKISL